MSSDDNTKPLPTAGESERSVLGSLMLDESTIGKIDLVASDFYWRNHQIIFEAVHALHDQGQPFDAVTVEDWLSAHSKAVPLGYTVEIAANTPSPSNILGYAKMVKDASIKRQLIGIGTDIANHGFNGSVPHEIADEGIAKLLRLSEQFNDEAQAPLDLFADHDFPVLNPNWLPPGVANYARDQAEIIGMPFDLLAMGCLSAISAAMSDDFVVKVKRNEQYYERSRLWIMLIAEPGLNKSLGIKRPMAPLMRIQGELSQTWQQAQGEFEQAKKVHNEMNKAAIKRQAKGEGFEEPPALPEAPKNRVVMINNATTEKLGELLTDNTRGIHWYADEICVWFGQHDAYARGAGGVDRGMALQAFDGGPYRFDRVGRGTTIVPNFSYSLVGTTQPDKIKSTVSGMSDDGLLQRFITVEIPHTTYEGESERLENEQYAKDWDTCLTTMWKWGEYGGGVIELSDEAEAVRKEFFEWVVRVAGTAGLTPSMRGHISKWRGIFPRLCLCYHAFGCAQQRVHIKSLSITGATAQRVVNFMKGYMLPNALRFYNSTVANADPTFLLAKKAAAMILANNMARLTNRDLQRGFAAWRAAPDWQKKAVITLLKQSLWLRGDGVSDSGWSVNPAVHRLYCERAIVERDQRNETAVVLAELRDLAQQKKAVNE